MPEADRQTGRTLSVMIAGGGTGGHLYPGIAVAREIVRRVPDARVSFAGTTRGIEARVVPAEGFALDFVRSAGLKGKSIAARARGALLLSLSALDAWRILSKRRPQVVIGVGGYSSGAVVRIAAQRGIATMVLEQNAVPGVTNRLLAPHIRAAAVTYDETLAYFHGRGFVAGNPVRSEFFRADGAVVGRQTPPRILILGGSQGAHVINLAMVAAAPELAREFPGLEIVHQTGERDLAAVREAYERGGITARAESFLDPVAREVKSADLIVSRAGATTLAELAAAGRPAVLVPFAAATDDHQRKNAEVLVKAGAAVMVLEADLSRPALAKVVAGRLADPAGLERMSAAMRGLAKPDAAARIVDRVLELAGRAT
jgi:UDP-N-acetylglucosamine--N-acetylmuramyl-(pentapeptide) pyrophosphoryl-undecaprenol N-acetylglucosamine transferase